MKKENLTELCYTLCLSYMMLFDILYKVTKMPYTCVFLMLIVMIFHVVFSKKIKNFRWICIVIVSILVNFFIALIFLDYKESIPYFISFCTLGLFGAYTSLFDVNETKVFRNVFCILLFYMFFFGGFQKFPDDYFNGSIRILPGICAGILLTFNLMEQKKRILAFGVAGISIYFFVFLLKYGSRGCVVSLLFFIISYILLVGTNNYLKVISIIFTISGVIFLLNIKKIIFDLENWLKTKNITFLFISKSVHKIRYGTLSSGRGEIAKEVFNLDDIFQVILGRGIAGFEAKTGNYTHNLFLDIFADYGLVGVFFLLLWTIHLLRNIKCTTLQKKRLYIFILGSCFFPLMFSFSYWRFPAFFLLINSILIEKKRKINKI